MDKHRILVVGTGSIGVRHVRCMLATGRAEVGVCEPSDERRREVASQHRLLADYAELGDALAQPWDAAVLAVPAPLHVPLAQRLADQGIGVLIEKPLAVEERGIAQLIESAEARGVAASVAYVYRAHPAVQAARQALLDGRFGRPLQLVVVSGQPFQHLRPAYRDIYYAHRDQGGGAIQDGLTHSFNVCEWLVGPITRIAVDAEHLALEGIEVEDTVNVLARHADRVLACYAVNHHQAPNESSITLVCERGTVRLEIKDNRWSWMDQPAGTWHEQATPLDSHDDWFTRQEQHFLDQIEGTCPPLCSLHEGWQTLRVNRAALASADHGGEWQEVVAPPIRQPVTSA